jgi:hypothetical protein
MRHYSFVPVFALAAAITAALPAWATSAVAPATVPQLAERSDLAVHGTVESIRTAKEGEQIFRYITLRVSDTLKGRTIGDAVTLKLYGGTYDGLSTIVLGAPCLSQGDEVVLFLKANGLSTYDVVSLAEGKFEVVRTASGPTLVRRDLSGISYEQGPRAPIPASLDELKAAVRSAAR